MTTPTIDSSDLETLEHLRQAHRQLRQEIGKIIIGQDSVLDQLLMAIFCRGHALLVGVPGLAKTLMVSTLAQSLDMTFKRIQFTPDLMPTDITGTEVIQDDPVTRQRLFKFLPGPLFANIVLADEINRTPPKTQAALLEAMQERKVSIGGTDYPMKAPFFVLATQNPIEQEGTYPLPEAQQDRFLFMIRVDYPTDSEEEQIMRMGTSDVHHEITKVLHGEDILRLQHIVRRVPVADHVFAFAKRITRMSRPGTPEAPDWVNKWLTWGAGPRASMNLILAAKAHAILAGNHHVSADDVAAVAPPILRHRLFANFSAQSEGISVDEIVQRLIRSVPKNQPLGKVSAYSLDPDDMDSYLHPDVVARAQALGLKARNIVEGLRVGDHKSPFRGFSVEFVQHREYVPGDDIRHIDWKSYGRSERYTIKQYEQETNYIGHILLDGSKSMLYGEGDTNKLEYAKVLAAALAYVIVHQRDSAGLAIFDSIWRNRLPISGQPGHVQIVLRALESMQPQEKTSIGPLLEDLAQIAKRRGLVFLISDCFDEVDSILAGLQHLRFQGHEVTVFHVLHPDELGFPFDGMVKFDALEDKMHLLTRPQLIRPAYLRALQTYLNEFQAGCEANRCDYVRLDTSRPLGNALTEYLARRLRVRMR